MSTSRRLQLTLPVPAAAADDSPLAAGVHSKHSAVFVGRRLSGFQECLASDSEPPPPL